MLPAWQFAVLALFTDTLAMAAAPQLYRQPAYESPVQGAPDDLVLLPGDGLAADDIVVYAALRDPRALAPPKHLPIFSDAEQGVAAIVSALGAPHSLTIKLPTTLRALQSYALWVRSPSGVWSNAITINDPRPLWASPAYEYATASPGGLPRELKIVGRNLDASPPHTMLARIVGPKTYTGKVLTGAKSTVIDEYVARLRLPEHLVPGRYRVQVRRDEAGWTTIPEQCLDVRPDPGDAAIFAISDAQFGGCAADDGADDAPCILRAVAAAARAGGGIVDFGPGTWDLIDGAQPGVMDDEGIVVPEGVQLRGAGEARTQLVRHDSWNSRKPTAGFTLIGHTTFSGFTCRDVQNYQPGAQAGPFIQLGEDWQRLAATPGTAGKQSAVSEVTITQNIFDRPLVAVGSGGLPIDRLFITHNIFGAYHAALELNGDKFDMRDKFRLDDSVIDDNLFKPGSELDLTQKIGTIASELAAGHRVDFSGNTADGASADYLYAPEDATGWRAVFFWNPNGNVEEVLVSQNTATCTGDKIGDGEAIAFDNNTNTFGFTGLPVVAQATGHSVAVTAPLAKRQNDRDVPVADYYVGHWIQVVSGPGVGQVRKILAYATDANTGITRFRVAPDWDVVPISGKSHVALGREYWQLYVIDNTVDNRRPLCKKSNRSRRVGGVIGLWAQTADSVIAGNHQYDSDGIFAQQAFGAADKSCIDCTMQGYFNFSLEIRDNVIDGEYDWANDCSRSGIGTGVAAQPWGDGPAPTVSFGVSISHNTIRHADEQYGGAIAQVNTWSAGPEPHRWPLSDNLLIHHNSIVDIDGPRARAICGKSRPRIGIAFPDPAIAWRTVLYANSCKNVSMPIGPGGIDTVSVCPSSVLDSCECPPPLH